MVAGDPSQTTPVHVFMLCCCTQIGCVEQHKMKKTCVICTDVVWLLSPAVASVPHANEAICKLTSYMYIKSTTNINSPTRSDNSP